MHRGVSSCLVVALFIGACVNSPDTAVGNEGSGITASADQLTANAAKLKIGMYVGDDTSESALTGLETNIGRHLDRLLVYHSIATPPDSVGLPELLAQLRTRGTALCLALEPATTMEDIDNGKYDAQLTAYGDVIALGGAQVWVRFASEMNGNWDSFDIGVDAKRNSAAHFKGAWKRAHRIISERLAANGASSDLVRWVFTAAAHPTWNIAAMWPGSDVVDVMAMDGYNQWGNGWRSFSKVFTDGYNALAALDPNLPIMIGEFSSDRADRFSWSNDRAAWIRTAASVLALNFPRISAFNWFNVGTSDALIRTHAYALTDDDGTMAAFRDVFGTSAKPVDSGSDAGKDGGAAGGGVHDGGHADAGTKPSGVASDLQIGLYLGYNTDEGSLAEAERNIGRHLDLLLVYHSIGVTPRSVDLPALLDQLARRGTALCLALEPPGTMAEVDRGDFDTQLTAYADAIANAGEPVWLRFASEMNGNWDSYDIGTDSVRNSAAHFIGAWTRAHHIFAERLAAAGRGSDLVKWVFTPAAHPTNNIASFWPGSAQVDVMSMDGYNQPGNGWRTFKQVFDDGYAALTALDATKPIFIGEFSSDRSQNFSAGGDRAAWIRTAASSMVTAYPRLIGFNWFDQGTLAAPANTHAYALTDEDGTYSAFRDVFGKADFKPVSTDGGTPPHTACFSDADCLSIGQVCDIMHFHCVPKK